MVTQADRQGSSSQRWVLLSYRVPREPSTPRIAVWRRLKKHGVVQVGDGLVALPADARTKEHLDWVAAMVLEADGEAIVWEATTTKRHDRELVTRMNEERDKEYAALLQDLADVGDSPTSRTLSRLRREWRRIDRRDYFRAPQREQVQIAIKSLIPSDQAAATEAATDVQA